jgi:hypothetical protein
MSSLDVHPPSLMTGSCYWRGSEEEERRFRWRYTSVPYLDRSVSIGKKTRADVLYVVESGRLRGLEAGIVRGNKRTLPY